MIIPLAKALELLRAADAVIFDDDAVTYAPVQEGGECFLEAEWETDDFKTFYYEFLREDNPEVEVKEGALWLKPSDDPLEPMKVTLLQKITLEDNAQ